MRQPNSATGEDDNRHNHPRDRHAGDNGQIRHSVFFPIGCPLHTTGLVAPGPLHAGWKRLRTALLLVWLTAPENPLFARVCVNRIWQWHFGEGLHKATSDFGVFAGVPSNPKLLDWLA
jgi:hypothetical protein